jgi:hypothetical protein
MSRNRIIYQSEALFISENELSTSEVHHKQLNRIQNIEYSFEIPRQYINQYGQLGAIDSMVVSSPTVSLNFSYYLTNLDNENLLGFYVKKQTAVYTGSNGVRTTKQNGNISGYTINNDSNFVSNKISKESGVNFYIATSSEGSDLNFENSISGKPIIGIGNALVQNYSIQAQVGQFPTVSVEMNGLNINSSLYKSYRVSQSSEEVGFPLPSVNIQDGKSLSLNNDGYYVLAKLPNPNPDTGEFKINALRPSDITLDFADFNSRTITNLNNENDALNLQSFSLTIDLNRDINQELGYKFVNSRPVQYPIIATLNVSAIVNEIQTLNLIKNIDDSKGKSILVSIKNPKNTKENAVVFDLRNFILTDESFVSNINENKNVNLTFQGFFGSSSDLSNGVFASGLISDYVNAELNNIYFNSNLATDWYNVNSWYSDSAFSQNANYLPQKYSNVIAYGTSAAVVDLDNSNWIQPQSIDTRNVLDVNGACFYSNNNAIFSGIVIGNSSFWGNASAG